MNLKQIREDAGLGRLQLADMAKVSDWKLRRAEAGQGSLDDKEMDRVEAVILAVQVARAKVAAAYLRNGLKHVQAR